MAVLFSKLLTKTDIEKRLALPTTKCLKSLPHFRGGYAIDSQAMDENDHSWTFRCSIRKNFGSSIGKKKYKKPVLSQGWLAFVRNKKLKIGDKINFYKDVGALCYRVQAEKEIKIFGAIFGYAPIGSGPIH